MMSRPTKPKKMAVFRGFASAVGLLAGLLVPVLAHAQQSIDTGKTPAEIFALDCATCHKGARGLAHGKSSSELASFLAEHYTSSKDQAAALAAYVMGAGGGDAVPAQARGPKTPPSADHPAAAADQQKPSAPGQHPGKPTGKPEETPSATAKLQPDEDKKPPGALPGRQTPAARNHRNGPEPVPSAPQPGAVVSEPAPSGAPVQEASPPETPAQSAAAPGNAEPGESAPVPRDDIPD
jgi:hypothetical protein